MARDRAKRRAFDCSVPTPWPDHAAHACPLGDHAGVGWAGLARPRATVAAGGNGQFAPIVPVVRAADGAAKEPGQQTDTNRQHGRERKHKTPKSLGGQSNRDRSTANRGRRALRWKNRRGRLRWNERSPFPFSLQFAPRLACSATVGCFPRHRLPGIEIVCRAPVGPSGRPAGTDRCIMPWLAGRHLSERPHRRTPEPPTAKIRRAIGADGSCRARSASRDTGNR